jgi:hypothetical protein
VAPGKRLLTSLNSVIICRLKFTASWNQWPCSWTIANRWPLMPTVSQQLMLCGEASYTGFVLSFLQKAILSDCSFWPSTYSYHAFPSTPSKHFIYINSWHSICYSQVMVPAIGGRLCIWNMWWTSENQEVFHQLVILGNCPQQKKSYQICSDGITIA